MDRTYSQDFSFPAGNSSSMSLGSAATSLFERSEPDAASIAPEDELSEEQLRELYDNEEIERFINIFSAFVTEVEAPDSPRPGISTPIDDRSSTHTSLDDTLDTIDETEWAEPRSSTDSTAPVPPAYTAAPEHTYNGIAEEIALKYVSPLLSRKRHTSPPFTLGRLRLTLQRLYLAIVPSYRPFLIRMTSLALWEDANTSMTYCALYWLLWWYDLLPTAFILRILWSILRRRLLPYPSLEELRRHRLEVSEADEFGAQISARFAGDSNDVKNIWKLARLLDQTRKTKVNFSKVHSPRNSEDRISPVLGATDAGTTVLGETNDEDDTELQQLALNLLNGIANVHERIRNIAIWRSQAASLRYVILLFGALFVTLLPTRYMLKMIFLGLGTLYWHVIPIFAALPPSDKKRIPPLLGDVPTDAEYAMELISQRVEAGLDIRPKHSHKSHRRKKASVDSVDSDTKHSGKIKSPTLPADWKKKIGINKFTDSSKRLFNGKPTQLHQAWPPQHPMMLGVLGIAQPQTVNNAHTFTCQHTTGLGVATLTPRLFFFTPFMSSDAKITIPLKSLKGVKKNGLLKGLLIRWRDEANAPNEVKEERFFWVTDRDELFARLVGTEGHRWLKV